MELDQPLLQKQKPQQKKQTSILRNRFTLLYEKMIMEPCNINDSSSEEERLVKSDIQYEVGSKVREAKDKQMFLEKEDSFIQEIQSDQNVIRSKQKRNGSSQNFAFRLRQSLLIQPTTYKDLNTRIFSLSIKVQKFLYYFNYVFNIIFRMSLLTVIIYLYSEKKRYGIATTLMALEIAVTLLYFIAMVKIIYTKSLDISVYFQKAFFEKPYAEIKLDRILRKHFTVQKICVGIKKLFQPTTQFNGDIKIKLFCQEILKRIQLILVFIPYMIFFSLDITKFQLQFLGSDTFVASSILLELIRFCGHYLIIYVLS